ncbi:uncharacterized protein F4812DRAFT_418933 [Daldinia caldariorum]|uniref:uncharacterized protein n=1 Tax=Daldinia caldariorum TaxID=326644 RepID=UPI0020089885|nr:uncharacterized protein F4812DRAFT_418933 [Daldinia caldariorum]KAI1470775.1 hypothetical protein F4812DRAFT_418933 [Daldinia caldariorum]
MCTGNQTMMSCGHALTNYTQYCEEGHSRPCQEPELSAPRAYIDDSCADCDPIYRSNQVRREHRDRHSELLDQVYAYKRAGHVEEVQRLLNRVKTLQLEANKVMGETRFLCPSSDHVEFPGGGHEALMPRGTCKWANGKCIWEDEMPYSVPENRHIKKVTTQKKHEESEEQSRIQGPPRLRSTKEYRDPFQEEAELQQEQEQPRILGPPRLRSTKEGYVDPFKEESEREIEQDQPPKVSQPPRLRTNKEYVGPRGDNVVISSGEEDEPQTSPVQPRLRRSQKYINKLNYVYCK